MTLKRNKKIKSLLHEHGAEFVRRKKHEIYKLPNGKVFTLSTSSRDPNVEKVQIKLLHKLLSD